MVDNRMYTFLELCTVLNYHKVAENLQMTQPAVTQHIQYLEQYYACKLFTYSNRKLSKTSKGIALENYARKVVSLSLSAQEHLLQTEKLQINIGATKTIGEYFLKDVMVALIAADQYDLHFVIDNTENLINQLNRFEFDVLLLEGYVDKANYLCEKIADAEIVGICSLHHPFAFQEVTLQDALQQRMVLREKGSGTRNVFEKFLASQGYAMDSIAHKSIVSSNKIIERAVEQNAAISFVYDVMQQQNPNLAYFKIKDKKIMHEFNFVFMNQEKPQMIIDFIRQNR